MHNFTSHIVLTDHLSNTEDTLQETQHIFFFADLNSRIDLFAIMITGIK